MNFRKYLVPAGILVLVGLAYEGDLARVEVPLDELPRFASEPVRSRVAGRMRELGFKFVTLDLDGLRSGSLNELVPLEVKAKFMGDAVPR